MYRFAPHFVQPITPPELDPLVIMKGREKEKDVLKPSLCFMVFLHWR
jgi:hypothetical protein